MEKKMHSLHFAIPLRALLNCRKITQKELSIASGVSASVICEILSGQIQMPRVDVLMKLSAGLQLYPDVLFFMAINPKDLDYKAAEAYMEHKKTLSRLYPAEMRAIEADISIQRLVDQAELLNEDLKHRKVEALTRNHEYVPAVNYKLNNCTSLDTIRRRQQSMDELFHEEGEYSKLCMTTNEYGEKTNLNNKQLA